MDWSGLTGGQQAVESNLIASIDYIHSASPVVAPGYESVTAQGQITTFEVSAKSFVIQIAEF